MILRKIRVLKILKGAVLSRQSYKIPTLGTSTHIKRATLDRKILDCHRGSMNRESIAINGRVNKNLQFKKHTI